VGAATKTVREAPPVVVPMDDADLPEGEVS
jgi:hypothetical protein